MKIAVYGTDVHPEFVNVYKNIFKLFEKNNIDFFLDSKVKDVLSNDYSVSVEETFNYKGNINTQFDLLLSIGGDGTFLNAIPIALKYDSPIAGVNCGRLGFLADINSEEIEQAINKIINNDYSTENRTLLEIVEPINIFGERIYAANELSVHKLNNSSMIKIETYINNEFLANYWADGLIISTPAGSTAYSLSVGGPIMMPTLSGLIITPISSHNLTVRPIVVPDNVEIEIMIEGRGDQFLVSIDHRSMPLDFSTVLKVRKAKETVKVIKLNGQSFYSTLRNKLMWGADKRN